MERTKRRIRKGIWENKIFIDVRAPLRRDILKSGLAAGGLIAAGNLVRTKAAIAATASGLDPVDPDIKFGTTSSIWGKPIRPNLDQASR